MATTRRWAVGCLLVLVAFVGLRVVHALQPQPVAAVLPTESVVLIGATGRYELTAADRTVLAAHGGVQFAAVSVRPRYIGDCAAAGWETLGAGRRTGVGGLCDPLVENQRVADWPQRVLAAAASHGDAQLGTLARNVHGCVAAVGPGAALAAAAPDGTLASYQTVDEFLRSGLAISCPVTLVDAGSATDGIVAALAGRPGTTLVVTGIGPPPGSHDPRPQVSYVVGVTPAGWLSSASTRRVGVINLTDLTRTLLDTATGGTTAATVAVDGAPLAVYPATVSVASAEHRLGALDALSRAALQGDLALGIAAALLVALFVACSLTGRLGAALVIAAWASTLPATMLLAGAVPWYETRSPALVLILTVAGWGAVLTPLVLATARRLDAPVAVVGAALAAAAFTVDAALGGVMEPGSMLNSRPTNGGRWYGFGNVTFAMYAAAVLVTMGYLYQRLRAAGSSRLGLVTIAVVGLGVVVCEGWPSMGADFGGVLALTPVVIWLTYVLSGVSVSSPRLVAAVFGAVVVCAAISWLDWRRGPGARSHLGAFVQRILDGDAQDVVIRKAVSAGASLVSPVGVGSVIVGVVIWILIIRLLLPRLAEQFSTVRLVAISVLSVAVLGTLLNDGGISVWGTATASFAVTAGVLWTEWAARRQAADDRRTRTTWV